MSGNRGEATYLVHNGRSSPMLLWLEPWAEEFSIPGGSKVELKVIGADDPDACAFELSETHLILFGPAGAVVKVAIDGVEQECAASEFAAPPMGKLGTRDAVELIFGNYPQTRPKGMGESELTIAASLSSPMADGDLRIEPLIEEHRAALKAACAQDEEIWPLYAISYDPDHFDESFERLRTKPDSHAFAILSGGELVGMSAYLGIDAPRGVVEIGNTYYVPKMRGTGFNRRVKDLMLRRAIECGFRRIEFRVDSRNARSQAAMAKLGAVREGVIRAERITWTGHVRDTVLFSILAEEWPR